MVEEQLLVRRIKEGTVIDHIEAGKSLRVLKALGIDGSEGNIVTIAMNVPSAKYGKKDIVKVEKRFLSRDETNKIALISPTATINIIKGYRVVEKRKVELPNVLIGVFSCTNPTCITNSGEPITSIIDVVNKEKQILKCRYCQRTLRAEELA
jgi:aspartate carbamoyltransferase regulatory subunit